MAYVTDAPAPARGTAREHILECAKRLFAERGYDGVSISGIARETGASKANIFHHFESKEGLYLAVFADIVDHVADQSVAFTAGRSVVESFQEMAAAELKEAVKDERGIRLILQEIISGNPMRTRRLAEEIFADRFIKLVECIRELQAEGTCREDVDPALAAHVLRSATAFYILGRDVLRHMPGVTYADDPDRYVREAVGLILRGLIAADSGERG